MKKINLFFQKPYLYIVIIIFGCLLKFPYLDNRLFWIDEISTIIHTTGIPLSDESRLPVNEIKHIHFYDSLLHINSQLYTITNQLYGLATDVHLTPGHYAYLIFWQKIVGDDPVDYRLFSVFIFITTLPLLFLFIKELYGSSLAGWISVSLFSVSPFVHIFTQEARYYILWVFFFIVTNVLFLKILKFKDYRWWILYSMAAVLSLYVSVLSGLFIAAHLIYILIFHRKLLSLFLVNTLVIILFYSPWIFSIYINWQQITGSMAWHIVDNQHWGVIPLIMGLTLGFTRSFVMIFDRNLYATLATSNISPEVTMMLISDLILIIFTFYMIIFLFRKTEKNIKWFLTQGIFPMVLFFFLTDIVRGSLSSWFWRYQIIIITGMGILASNLLYHKISEGKLLFNLIYLILVLFGFASIFSISNNRCIMTRSDCQDNINDARLFSVSEKTLIITDLNLGVANFFVILNECSAPEIDILNLRDVTYLESKINIDNYTNIFITHASDNLVKNLNTIYGKEMLPLKDKVDRWASQVWYINRHKQFH